MSSFEWLAIGYFVIAAATGWRSPHWRRGCLYAAGASALVIVARFALPWEARAWMPHLYLVLGYWIPAVFTPAPAHDRFERWLARTDSRLVGWCQARARHVPGTNSASPAARGSSVLELAYLLCYPMVPATFAVVFARGSSDDVASYWIAVLLAGYACYGTLRWTAARPPRIVQRAQAAGAFGAANACVLARVSHGLNTFPSGHVAVSIAAAGSAARVSIEAGLAFGVLAATIAVAAAAGRYHYIVDVLLGAMVGAAALLPLAL